MVWKGRRGATRTTKGVVKKVLLHSQSYPHHITFLGLA